MSRWQRILIWVGIAVCAGGIYLSQFGAQTACALVVHYQFRELPDVARRPTPLLDLSVSGVPHKAASYFGYDFELPSDDVEEGKDKTFGTVHVSYFRSGNSLWFSTFRPKDFVTDVMKTTKLSQRDMTQLFGEDALESDYAFQKKMLELTPSEITPFISRRQAISGQALLMLKATSMPKAGSGIFSIESGDFRGFQFENPQERPSRVTVELFSDDGGVNVIFIQKPGAAEISQPEINRVIQSIHKTPLPAASITGSQNEPKSTVSGA